MVVSIDEGTTKDSKFPETPVCKYVYVYGESTENLPPGGFQQRKSSLCHTEILFSEKTIGE